MAEREWRWTIDGMNSTARNGVDPTEVVDAAYSAQQYINDYGSRLVLCAPAESGRLIVISADRWAPEIMVYLIVSARVANVRERRLWEGMFS